MNSITGYRAKVDWLEREAIEQDAQQLLYEYQEAHGFLSGPPLPIENIIERFLKLELEIDDLQTSLQHPDVIGAIYFDDRRIVIDSTIEGEDGRFNFTCAHEAMHWRLHRRYFLNNPDQISLFGEDNDCRSSFVCRESQSEEPHEWQANYGAACLLMPQNLLIDVVKKRFSQEDLMFKGSKWMTSFDEYSRGVAASINKDFAVSITAMAIRLQQLHILRDVRNDIFQ